MTTADGEPIAGAIVCTTCGNCEPLMAPPPRCVETQRLGRYTLRDVEAGGHRVTARAQDYIAGVAPELVFLDVGESREGVDVALLPGETVLRGSVLDATGGPVPGATVRAIRILPPTMTLAVEADDEGRFAVTLPAGAVVVEASGDGYAPARVTAVVPSQGLELRLLPGGRVMGHVRTADGHDVADVEVVAAPASNPFSPLHRAARSGPDGAYVIDGLEPGEYALTATGPGLRGMHPGAVTVQLADVVHDVDVLVEGAFRVSGHVTIAGTQPCRRGFVTLGPFGTEQFLNGSNRGSAGPSEVAAPRSVPPMLAMIDFDGGVTFESVPAGEYLAVVQCFDHVLKSGPDRIAVETEDLADLEWDVSPGIGLRVAVVDSVGRPVPHAPFFLQLPTANGRTPVMPVTADAAGLFTFPGFMHAGAYRIRPAHPFEGDPVDVELREGSGSQDVTLRMAGSGTILVDMADQEGRTVDHLQVTATRTDDALGPNSAGPLGSFLATALGDGSYRIGPLAAGTYRVVINDGLNAPLEVGEATDDIVLADGAEARVSASLDRSGRIKGVVEDQAGDPVANVAVVANAGAVGSSVYAIPQASRVLTDFDGHFAITRLNPSDAYRVRADDPSLGTVEVSGVTAHVGSEPLRLTLAQGPLATSRARQVPP